MSNQIDMVKCKRNLTKLWFIGSGFPFLMLFFQSLSANKYGDKLSEAWGWLLPTIMPSLSLIIGVLILDVSKQGIKTKMIDSFIYRLTFTLSLIYLIFVSLTFILPPIANIQTIEFMKKSNLWLGPFQGLVSASLGVFFIKREKS